MDFIELATSRYSVRDFSPMTVIVCYEGTLSWKNSRDAGHPVAVLPLGYPSESCKPSDRHLSYRNDSETVKML